MIELKNVERSYKTGHTETWVLRRIGLTIKEGEFVTVMGPSGAGKSSLLNVLALLDDSWLGEYWFGETPVHKLNRKQRADLARQRIGMVFQSYHLLDDLTVAENIDLPLSYKNLPAKERQGMVADILDRFQIVAKKDLFPSQLSGGQQQLVGIARAVVHAPALLLADEPTGNLHSTQAREIMELFCELNRQGTTIVQVTHSEENARYGKRIVELRDGWLTRDETFAAKGNGGRCKVNLFKNPISAKIARKAVAAIFLLQVNLAFGLRAEPVSSSASQAAPANSARAGSSSARGQQPAPRLPRWPSRCSRRSSSRLLRRCRFNVPMPRSRNPLSPYRPSTAPPLDLNNSPRLQNLIRDGKLYVSLHDVIAVAIENNLDLAYFRYNFPIAQTDILRTKAGSPANGVNTAIVQSTQGGFAASTGGGGGSSGSGFSAGNGGIVTSTLGAGTSCFVLRSLPQLPGLRGSHCHPGGQRVPDRRAGSEDQHHRGPVEFLPVVPHRHKRLGQLSWPACRQQHSVQQHQSRAVFQFCGANPQPFLAGFGLSTNERFIRIAKRNSQITDLAFKAQVIATVTQVENIYWDLVNAYRTSRSMSARSTLPTRISQDDQKQLELQAIPAMQVMTDQSAVATAEGNLTVARASLRLNELLMKNALTKVG